MTVPNTMGTPTMSSRTQPYRLAAQSAACQRPVASQVDSGTNENSTATPRANKRKDFMRTISIEKAREMLAYDPTTGNFTWRKKPNRCIPVGAPAGFAHCNGYLSISLGGVTVLAHRLAFAMTHGYWPDSLIDHRDGNKRNNSIANLRAGSKSLNALNQHGKPRSSTGFRGVHHSRSRRRFVARLNNRYLGSFPTAEEASAAYVAAKAAAHPELMQCTHLA